MSNRLDADLVKQFSRVPPYSTEAEESLIGSILSPGGEEYVSECRGLVTGEMFYQEDRRTIWEAALRLHDRGLPVDIVTIREAIIASGSNILTEIGGTAYLAQMFNAVPAAAHAIHYAKIVRDKYVKRQAIFIGNELIRLAHEQMEPGEMTTEMLHKSEDLIRAASDASQSGAVSLEGALQMVIDRADSKKVRREKTGIFGLDQFIGGIPYGGCTVIAGEPGMGKSQLMKQFIMNMATNKVPCGIITVEEGREKIAENYLAAESGVPNHKIAYDRLAPEDWGRLTKAAGSLAGRPIYIEDSSFSLTEIEIAARRLVAKHGCKVIAVDHMHLVSTDKGDNRTTEVSAISSGLKRLYRKLGVAGISLCQLNRSHNQGERPTLRSLRDSSTIEQDGDLIMLLYREDKFKFAEKDYIPNNVLEIIVAKNKSGGPCVYNAHFDGNRQTVTDGTKDPFAPVPDPY